MEEYICEISEDDKYFQRYGEIKQKIVRCKDCKHKEKDGISEGYHYCDLNGLQVTDDWFCADGAREDENNAD